MQSTSPKPPHLRAVDSGPPDSASTGPQREQRLVELAREGDSAAWARLYQDNFDRLYRDARYLVPNAEAAEDVVQEAFACALTSLAHFDGRASFIGWVRGIAHNLVRRRWRTQDRRGRAYDGLQHTIAAAAPPNDPELAQQQQQRAAALREVLTMLPAPLRETFLLRDVQGLPVEEVAQRLETTSGNIRVRANRARGKIRTLLASRGWLGLEDAR